MSTLLISGNAHIRLWHKISGPIKKRIYWSFGGECRKLSTLICWCQTPLRSSGCLNFEENEQLSTRLKTSDGLLISSVVHHQQTPHNQTGGRCLHKWFLFDPQQFSPFSIQTFTVNDWRPFLFYFLPLILFFFVFVPKGCKRKEKMKKMKKKKNENCLWGGGWMI